MKTVYDNDMVAHVWAAQTQPDGRSHNGNFYFSGRTLYSYGRHFPVGIIRSDCVLLNSDHYGVTTARHKNAAYYATRHLTQVYVPDLRHVADSLAILSRADEDRHESARKAIIAHVRDHMSRASNPDAIHLLTIARVRNPAAAHARMVQQAARAAAKRAARDALAEFRSRLAYAARIAKSPAAELIAWRDRLDSHQLPPAATHLFHAHRAAVKAGRTRQAADVWALLKGVRGRIATMAARAARKERNRYLMGATAALRLHIDSHAAGTMDRAWNYKTFADSAETIARDGRALGGLNRATFETIATAARAERDRLAQLENAAEFARQEAARAAWLNGGPYWRGTDATGGAMLRVVGVERDESGRITGGTLQTSRGADVPLVHAIAALRFIRAARESGRPWTRNGATIRVGHFQIDSIDPAGNFRAGCHSVNWTEVDRIATQLDV